MCVPVRPHPKGRTGLEGFKRFPSPSPPRTSADLISLTHGSLRACFDTFFQQVSCTSAGVRATGRRCPQPLAAAPRPQCSGVTSVSRRLTRLTSHARTEVGRTGPLGPWNWFWLAWLAMDARKARAEGGNMVEGSTTVTADNLVLPCPCASIPRLLAVFVLDGTRADVSSPNGCDWVSRRGYASTRTARRWGWWFFPHIHSSKGEGSLACTA